MRIVGFCFRLAGGLLMGALVALLFGWLVQLLWNWLMPALFHLPAVTFWQAAGLVLLSRLLFGHVGGHHGHHKWKKKFRRGRCAPGWCGPGRPGSFGPRGGFPDWERFDEWWENGGEQRYKAFHGGSERGWDWWKWWKKEGRAGYEAWLAERKSSAD